MAPCPERGCVNGVLRYGGGSLHERSETGCPTCGGLGSVPDPVRADPELGLGTVGEGCAAKAFGVGVLAVVGVMALGTIAIVALAVIALGGADETSVLAGEASETRWEGQLECASGPVGIAVNLTVPAGSSDGAREVSATATYATAPEGPEQAVPRTSFRGTLTGRELQLVATRPPSEPYHLGSLSATIDDDGDLMLGTGQAAECGNLGLDRTG